MHFRIHHLLKTSLIIAFILIGLNTESVFAHGNIRTGRHFERFGHKPYLRGYRYQRYYGNYYPYNSYYYYNYNPYFNSYYYNRYNPGYLYYNPYYYYYYY